MNRIFAHLFSMLLERPQYRHNLPVYGYVANPLNYIVEDAMENIKHNRPKPKLDIRRIEDRDGFTSEQSSENRRLRKSKSR